MFLFRCSLIILAIFLIGLLPFSIITGASSLESLMVSESSFTITHKDVKQVPFYSQDPSQFSQTAPQNERQREGVEQAMLHLFSTFNDKEISIAPLFGSKIYLVNAKAGRVLAETSSESREIYLFASTNYSDPEEGWAVILHEFGHIIDTHMFTREQMNHYYQLRGLDLAQQHSQDWSQNPKEIFAEDFAMLFLPNGNRYTLKTSSSSLKGEQLERIREYILEVMRGYQVYEDINSSHWAYPAVDFLKGKGIVPSIENLRSSSSLHPNDWITKGKLVNWFVKAVHWKYPTWSEEQIRDHIPSIFKQSTVLPANKEDVYLLIKRFIPDSEPGWMHGLDTDEEIKNAYLRAIALQEIKKSNDKTAFITRAEAWLVLMAFLKDSNHNVNLTVVAN